MAEAFDDDRHCFVCGEKNPFGLRLQPRGEDGRGIIVWTPDSRHQGYSGVVHGGLISTLLDEAMAYAAMSAAGVCATAEISVRFRSPVMTSCELTVEAQVVEERGRVLKLTATATQEGSVKAEGRATFVRVPGKRDSG